MVPESKIVIVFASVSLFLVFCIMYGSLIQIRKKVSQSASLHFFQLLPFPCWGGSRNSMPSVFTNSMILPMASPMNTGSRIKELISSNSANWLRKILVSSLSPLSTDQLDVSLIPCIMYSILYKCKCNAC